MYVALGSRRCFLDAVPTSAENASSFKTKEVKIKFKGADITVPVKTGGGQAPPVIKPRDTSRTFEVGPGGIDIGVSAIGELLTQSEWALSNGLAIAWAEITHSIRIYAYYECGKTAKPLFKFQSGQAIEFFDDGFDVAWQASKKASGSKKTEKASDLKQKQQDNVVNMILPGGEVASSETVVPREFGDLGQDIALIDAQPQDNILSVINSIEAGQSSLALKTSLFEVPRDQLVAQQEQADGNTKTRIHDAQRFVEMIGSPALFVPSEEAARPASLPTVPVKKAGGTRNRRRGQRPKP